MYLFILIILIAELIIATAIICQIIKIDRWAISTNNLIEGLRPDIESNLDTLKKNVKKLVDNVKSISVFLEVQRKKVFFSIIQNILVALLIITLKGKRKKYLSGMQLVFALKDFWNS